MTVRCPECGKTIEADPATIRTLRCPHCGYRDRVQTEPTPGHRWLPASNIEDIVDAADN